MNDIDGRAAEEPKGPAGSDAAAENAQAASDDPHPEQAREEAAAVTGAEEAGTLGIVPPSDAPKTGLPPGDIPPPAPAAAKSAAAPAKPVEGESWMETVKTVVYALLIALVIRTLFFQPFNIPSASMEGTLKIGDYLFVEKFAYGYSRFSMPFGRYLPSFGRIFFSPPARGDVVVFKMPNKNSPDYMEDFIKRVIGLPGDRIQMINDRLYINDKIVPRVRVADYIEKIDGFVQHVPQYRETLPNGKSYLTLDRETDGPFDNTQLFVVPPGHYFMMGDNRDNSDDSRADVGYVPAENLEGKAEFRFFSINESAAWWQIWKWPWAVRYNRLFTGID
jgi:signal peptidase I